MSHECADAGTVRKVEGVMGAFMDNDGRQPSGLLPNGRKQFAIYFDDPSLTVQSEKDETDINKIIAKVAKGGDLLHVNERVAKYGDFADVPSYQEALDYVSRAQGSFMAMSPQVRERFGNDPGKMILFLQDEKNYDEAVKLGLIVAKPTPPVEPGEPVAPSSGPGE